MGNLIDRTVATLEGSPELLLLFKATLVLAIGLIALVLMARANSSLRHLVLAATFGALAVLPIVGSASVAMTVAIPITSTPAGRTPTFDHTVRTDIVHSTPAANTDESGELDKSLADLAFEAPQSPGSSESEIATPATWKFLRSLMQVLWLGGALTLLLHLIVHLIRLHGLRQEAEPSPILEAAAQRIAAGLGIRRPITVRAHHLNAGPFTFGAWHPTILLPADAVHWEPDALHRALVHEVEHVRRYDWLVQVTARLVCIVYWCIPLVWIAWRSLRLEAERASDDAVVSQADAVDYADQLVALARRTRHPAELTLGMACRRDLAVRIAALLYDQQARGRAGRRVVTLALATATGFAAALAPLRVVPDKSHFDESAQNTAQQQDPPVVVAATSPSHLVRSKGDATTAHVDGRAEERKFQTFRTKALDHSLFRASRRGNIAAVQRFLDEGANPNVTIPLDGSSLIAAAKRGHLAICELLLARGADANLAVLHDGNPLIAAAASGHIAIVRTLVRHGARVEDIVPGDENPLIGASEFGHLDVVRFLIAQHANVNSRVFAPGAKEWRTPLRMATRNGHDAVATHLRLRGAVDR